MDLDRKRIIDEQNINIDVQATTDRNFGTASTSIAVNIVVGEVDRRRRRISAIVTVHKYV